MRKARYHDFVIKGMTFIPYRHHKNSLLWLVSITDGEMIMYFRSVALDAEEAAHGAARAYENYMVEELNLIKHYEKQRKEMEEKKKLQEKKSLKEKKVNG